MSLQRIASRYAKSLLDLAIEKAAVAQVLDDIKVFQSAMGHGELYRMIKSPIISSDKKRSVFEAIFKGKLGDITYSFLDIVVRKGREEYLPEIANAFVMQYKILNNITTAKLITAIPATETLIAQVKNAMLTQGLASGEIDLQVKTNKHILGGLILEIEDRVYDASVKTKLANVKKAVLDNSSIKSI